MAKWFQFFFTVFGVVVLLAVLFVLVYYAVLGYQIIHAPGVLL